MRIVFAIVIAMTTVVAPPVLGHHSEAPYDAESVVAFQGTVTQFSWRNPHVYITVETIAVTGEQVEWEIETGGTPLLVRSGWARDSLMPGDRISVRAHPARESGRYSALLLSLEKEDGTVLEQTIGDSQPTASASDLSGVWKGSLPPPADFIEQLHAIPLKEKGAAARDEFDSYLNNPAAMCIAYPSPLTIAATTAYLSEIQLSGDVIVIRNEFFDVERTVFMDGRGHSENDERTTQGHSVGRWEGTTLVVDTTQFADHRSPYGNGVPSGAQKHVVEKYTLSEDGDRVMIDIFMEDPEYLAEPFTSTLEWTYRPDLRLLRFDCDLEVSGQYIPNNG